MLDIISFILYRLRIKNGELALIHGASGAVGIAGVQIAKAHGMLNLITRK